MVRLRDTAVVLVPARQADSNGHQRVTWSAWTEYDTPFQADQAPTGAATEDDTGLATWRGFLPSTLDGIVTTSCRILWHGETYKVDGPIVRHRRGSRVRYLTVPLKAVPAT